MTKRQYGQFLSFAASFFALLSAFILISSRDVWADSQFFENCRPTTTEPVNITIGQINYIIPRNYLCGMNNFNGGPQEMVSLRVAYPGFRPYNEDTKSCFLYKIKCRIIEFNIRIASKYGTEEYFKNLMRTFNKKSPRIDQYGYEVYNIGIENGHANEIYRKKIEDRYFVFHCMSFSNNGIDDGICDSHTETRSGGEIFYFFSKTQIRDAAEVDSGLRDLVDSFVVGGRQ